MAVPETDLARVARFCDAQVPPEMRDQVRVEMRRRGATVTVVECRPAWISDPEAEWTELPQARMKYDAEERGWTLYWFDRNSKAHRYELLAAHQPIARLLDEYDRDPTCIFKG